jgi:hypothetical protein
VPVNDTDIFPDGKTTLRANAVDYATNDSDNGPNPFSWNIYIDRVAPKIEGSGNLWDMGGKWSNPDGMREVKLTSTDSRSGIVAYELQAHDQDGKELYNNRFDIKKECTKPLEEDHVHQRLRIQLRLTVQSSLKAILLLRRDHLIWLGMSLNH